MATQLHNANGSRRRALVKRVLAEEHTCALCDRPLDKTLTFTPGAHGKKCPGPPCAGCIPDPLRVEVDEDIPRSRGGSPYDRANCHAMCRRCNQWKSTMTLAEAREKLHGDPTALHTPTKASPIW